MATISGLIHTYNAEEFLERCIQSLQDCDEIVICDMYSTDKTLEIAKKYNCKILMHENVGIAEPARDFAISNCSSDYVLTLDADEYASKDLVNNLRKFLSEQENPPEGIRIFYKNAVLGKILHSYSKKGILRCYKRGHVHYEPVVHAAPQIKGRTEYFNDRKNSFITHDMVTDITEHAAKWNKYSGLEVQGKFKLQKRKFKVSKLFTRPILEFIKIYFLKQGFRDGLHGYIFAVIAANYKFMTLVKHWEAEIKAGNRK